jgi:amidase
MHGNEDFLFLDATAQAELVFTKAVKPLDLVEASIARIEKLNPTINALVFTMFEEARIAAEGDIPKGPFTGVPFLLKDFLVEMAGTPMHEGSRFLQGFIPEQDSELVRRYKRAGLIVLGKTNTPELAIGVTTEPRLFGPTHNPWDTARTPGGSSGGSAAAVAARMVSMAHGNDAGGSLRIPGSCCGVFALKPTRGRNSLGPRYGDLFSGLVAEHALTLSVRDSAALLDATAGPCPGDPYHAPSRTAPFLQEMSKEPGRLQIAFSRETPLKTAIHPDCADAALDAARLCEALGHRVVEAFPPLDWEALWLGFTTVLAAGLAWTIRDWHRRLNREPVSDSFEPFIQALYDRGESIRAPEYLTAIFNIQAAARKMAAFFEEYDIWLTPTLGAPPVNLGTFTFDGGDPFELRRRMTAFSPFTFVANATGQPAMSVPLFWNAANLPIGTHFMGRFGDEATLFRLARQLETARPWLKRVPASVTLK